MAFRLTCRGRREPVLFLIMDSIQCMEKSHSFIERSSFLNLPVFGLLPMKNLENLLVFESFQPSIVEERSHVMRDSLFCVNFLKIGINAELSTAIFSLFMRSGYI